MPKARIYSFDDHPEHRAQLDGWAKRWIANAMSTKAMDDDDRAACITAVNGLYAAAKLPPPKHIVFVPSPFVLAFAGGFAASIWHRHKTGFVPLSATLSATDSATLSATASATDSATLSATLRATDSATRSATLSATLSATDSATLSATGSATDSATDSATASATLSATRRADLSKWYVVAGDMRRLAYEMGVGDFGLRCAAQAFQMWQGGNQWSAWDSYLSFFQDIAKLDIDYSGYTHWRTLAERSGPRIMHPDFCMISDRPEVLTVDAQDQPHAEDGPFCRWRDGSALYSWHGIRVPARWIEEKATLNPAEIIRAANVEERAAGAAIIGWPRMLSVLKVKVVDDSGSSDIGQLIELTLPGLNQPGRFLKAACPRNGIIVEGVPRVSDIDGLPIETALHAQAWRIGDPLSEYVHPEVRT